jgi:hypothetical protein
MLMSATNHSSARMNAFISLAFGAVILATSPAAHGVGWDSAGAGDPDVGWDSKPHTQDVGWD